MLPEQPLKVVYADGVAGQADRYAAALAAFRTRYGDGPVDIFRAPGRVNIIGEHTDYNHGYVLPVALDKDLLFLARRRCDARVRLANLESDFAPAEFVIDSRIPSGPQADWSNYVRGAAQTTAQTMHQLDLMPPSGLDVLVAGQTPQGVPRSAGLSSSSALTVVAMLAFLHDSTWSPPPSELARLCSDAEWYVGTRGGIMDQFIALLGARDHALFLDCRPGPTGEYASDRVPLPASHRLLIVESGVKHSNVRGEYNQRVASCRAAVGLLAKQFPGISHLRDVEHVPWSELAPLLPERIRVDELASAKIELGDIPGITSSTTLRVASRCRHVWSENHRVLTALDAMASDDIAGLGALLDDAHASARDDYEISCPEIEALVVAAREVDGVAGARLTGAGWGGCIIAMVHADAVEEFQRHVSQRYSQSTGLTCTIFPCRAGAGAGHVCRV